MRPPTQEDLMVRTMEIVRDSESIKARYPEDVQSFLHYLLQVRAMTLSSSRSNTEDWKYESYQDIMLDLAEIKRAPIYMPDEFAPMEVKMCFYNAYIMATENPHLTYVEGYAEATFLATPHAWLEAEDGTIIDPTWANLELPAGHIATYMGVRFSTSYIRRHALKTGYTGVLSEDWRLDCRALRQGFITDDTGLVIDDGLTEGTA